MRPPTDYDGGARMPTEAEERDARAPAMMICARLAGRAIIRVVGRCEDAQENSQLGTLPLPVTQLVEYLYLLTEPSQAKKYKHKTFSSSHFQNLTRQY